MSEKAERIGELLKQQWAPYHKGRCYILSKGDACGCHLCLIDDLTAMALENRRTDTKDREKDSGNHGLEVPEGSIEVEKKMNRDKAGEPVEACDHLPCPDYTGSMCFDCPKGRSMIDATLPPVDDGEESTFLHTHPGAEQQSHLTLSHHVVIHEAHREKALALQAELTDKKDTCRVWFERYSKAREAAGLEPHQHKLPAVIAKLQAALAEKDKRNATDVKIILGLSDAHDRHLEELVEKDKRIEMLTEANKRNCDNALKAICDLSKKRSEVKALEEEVRSLRGLPFSDRMYAAIKSRMEVAEAKLKIGERALGAALAYCEREISDDVAMLDPETEIGELYPLLKAATDGQCMDNEIAPDKPLSAEDIDSARTLYDECRVKEPPILKAMRKLMAKEVELREAKAVVGDRDAEIVLLNQLLSAKYPGIDGLKITCKEQSEEIARLQEIQCLGCRGMADMLKRTRAAVVEKEKEIEKLEFTLSIANKKVLTSRGDDACNATAIERLEARLEMAEAVVEGLPEALGDGMVLTLMKISHGFMAHIQARNTAYREKLWVTEGTVDVAIKAALKNYEGRSKE